MIRRPGTSAIVAAYDGAIAGVGIEATLAPGESRDIAVLGGTATCDPALGFALPEGDYEVVVDVLGASIAGPNSLPLLSAGPVALHVVDAS